MPDEDAHAVDVAIVARATAKELWFHAQPEVRTRFPGSGDRDSRQTTTRRNVDSPVEPRKTYRRVFAVTRISSRLIDENR
jgi:hypothetical protein